MYNYYIRQEEFGNEAKLIIIVKTKFLSDNYNNYLFFNYNFANTVVACYNYNYTNSKSSRLVFQVVLSLQLAFEKLLISAFETTLHRGQGLRKA